MDCLGSSPHVRGALQRLCGPVRARGIIPACAGSTHPICRADAMRWDHPRMCGEHCCSSSVGGGVAGSSPHVRGALRVHRIVIAHLGIIPACAGSTKGDVEIFNAVRDHPRMCGEHPVSTPLGVTAAGSSPHVRGALGITNFPTFMAGIIPACAGSTGRCVVSDLPTRDHPRMCGEHTALIVKACRIEGSSPHVRGARRPCILQCLDVGIIPACAGSTALHCPAPPLVRDHPRMCGEHLRLGFVLPHRPGSSPHVRGAHSRRLQRRHPQGIIPACAGSTVRRSRMRAPLRDHPRMCGEHCKAARRPCVRWGSSPHVRGAPGPVQIRDGTIGIIPACAGSTLFHSEVPFIVGDHPRMCGEHSTQLKNEFYSAGSSPHVRGALTVLQHISYRRGIIPACAGSTRTLAALNRYAGDHPRMCGEHSMRWAVRFAAPGSSPHVRGARASRRSRPRRAGIIPACAGSTRCDGRRSRQRR